MSTESALQHHEALIAVDIGLQALGDIRNRVGEALTHGKLSPEGAARVGIAAATLALAQFASDVAAASGAGQKDPHEIASRIWSTVLDYLEESLGVVRKTAEA